MLSRKAAWSVGKALTGEPARGPQRTGECSALPPMRASRRAPERPPRAVAECKPHQSPTEAPQGLVTRRSFVGAVVLAVPSLAIPGVRAEEAAADDVGRNAAVADVAFVAEEDDEVPSRVFETATPSVAAVLLLKLPARPQGRVPPFARGGQGATGAPEGEEVTGTGSGIVWDKFGHVVTNYHVVAKVVEDRASVFRCEVALLLPGGAMHRVPARVIGTDPSKDLAVLKVEDVAPEELSPALIGSSADLRVGQSCFALGNPRGFLHTLTAGVVSGLGRAIPAPTGQVIGGAIQTDAAINAGNSGGPLLDSAGRVIGINTATFTRSGSGTSSGVNFAVPVDTVVRVVPPIIVYGTPTRAYNAAKKG